MGKWILTKDKRSIADELSPDKPVIVILDTSIAKWLLGVMNDEREADKKLAFAKEDIKELKLKITQLNLKLSRRDACLKEAGIESIKGRRKGTKATPSGEHRKYADKMCPGAGSKAPHMFTPSSGRQTMCPECRQILADIKKQTGPIRGTTIRTTWRGPNHPNSIPEPKITSESLLVDAVVPEPPKPVEEPPKKLTVEEVLRMDDGPEKKALEANFTVAEKMEAAKLRYKIEREKWKAMRNRGFSLDNPIVGVGPGLN